MPLIARASNTVRNKNIVIFIMCALFTGWFAYDGFRAWPEKNNHVIARTLDLAIPGADADARVIDDIKSWPAWEKAGAQTREHMDAVMKELGPKFNGDWKNSFDITLQRWLVLGLGAATAFSVWWIVHCQRRRAMADDATVSPAPGVSVPWEKIKVVDNTRWKSHGIVEITFPGADGKEQRGKFDDYETDREPLLQILDQLAMRAVNAEFIPKEEEPPAKGDTPADKPS